MKEYLTDKQLYDIQCAIYNDDNKALLEALPQTVGDTFEGEIFETVTKDKRWTFIGDTEYILTEDGLVFHSRFQRIIKIIFSPHRLYTTIKGTSYYLDEIFEEKGWPYDYNTILNFYKDKGYGMYVNKRYRKLYDTM